MTLPPSQTSEAQRLREVAHMIREARAKGQTVAILSYYDFEFYHMADVVPFYRYSPLLAQVWTRPQLDDLISHLRRFQPTYVLMSHGNAFQQKDDPLLWGALLDALSHGYHRHGVCGGLDVYSLLPE